MILTRGVVLGTSGTWGPQSLGPREQLGTLNGPTAWQLADGRWEHFGGETGVQ